jgi:O-antigen/teichoic acid export membrane protein
MFPLISFPYASRILGPDGIGKSNFIDGYTQYFCLVAALGIPIYGVREVAKVRNDPQKLSTLISELIFLNFAASLLCCVLFYGIAILTGKYQVYGNLYVLGSIVLVFSSFVAEWFFQGMELFKYVSLRSFFLNMASLALLFVFVKTKNDVTWYYGIGVIALVGNVLVNVLMLGKETSFTFKGLRFKHHLKPLLLLFSTQMAISVYLILDKVILGYMADDKYVGYYSSSLKITRILLTVISALAVVMMPQMSKAFFEKDEERVRALYRKSSNFVISVGTPVAIGLISLAGEITTLIAGKDFGPATTSLRLVAPTVLIIGLSNIFGMQILTAKGKEKVLFYCVIVGMLLNVLANLLLIPYFKHNGTAVAILVTELFVTVVTGYYASREIREPFAWKSLGMCILCCLPFLYIHFLVAGPHLLLTVALTALISLVYYSSVQVYILKNTLWVDLYERGKKIFVR